MKLMMTLTNMLANSQDTSFRQIVPYRAADDVFAMDVSFKVFVPLPRRV